MELSVARARWGPTLALCLALGCEEAPPEPSPEPSPESASEPASESAEASPRPTPAPVSAAPSAPELAPPSDGCALTGTRDLGPGAWSDVVAWEGGFAVALLVPDGDRETLRLVDVGGAPIRELGAALLDLPAGPRRAAGPALAADGERLMVAFVDGGGRLRVASPRRGRRLTPRTVATGASLRFRPALAAVEGGWAIAWTDARETPMRVRSRALAPDGQARGDERDLTPLAGGAAAPTMVAAASPPRLVFLDPRQATSVSLRAPWAEAGFGAAEVARPVGLVTEPPEIAAVQVGERDWLAYTGIGNLATTAVGLVPLGGTEDPARLIPGTGYGTLHVDGDRLGAGAVFVADAPRARPPDSPRELHLRALDPTGTLGAPLVVAGPDDEADRGRVAAQPDGRVSVAFRAGSHSWIAAARCALP